MTHPSHDVQIDTVVRFDRAVTRHIGVLEAAYLSRRRPAGLSKLLREIGTEGTQVRVLRRRLGLDSGHVSRELRRLESEGLVTTEAEENDGRVRRVRLTDTGASERALLDRAAEALATSMLEPLTASRRDRLVAAMAEVENLLGYGPDPAAQQCTVIPGGVNRSGRWAGRPGAR